MPRKLTRTQAERAVRERKARRVGSGYQDASGEAITIVLSEVASDGYQGVVNMPSCDTSSSSSYTDTTSGYSSDAGGGSVDCGGAF